MICYKLMQTMEDIHIGYRNYTALVLNCIYLPGISSCLSYYSFLSFLKNLVLLLIFRLNLAVWKSLIRKIQFNESVYSSTST